MRGTQWLQMDQDRERLEGFYFYIVFGILFLGNEKAGLALVLGDLGSWMCGHWVLCH